MHSVLARNMVPGSVENAFAVQVNRFLPFDEITVSLMLFASLEWRIGG